MAKKYYTNEKNAQIVLSLLKAHGIKRVIASPGTTNMALVGSMQQDPYFEMYSAVDERSAAYMACGLAAETSEPVVISCTGATASRNYLPGLTEAFYRKLPILSITSTQPISRVGHHMAQIIDRENLPNDVANLSLQLPLVKDDEDVWDCEIKVNRAILELNRRGGGPVHLNLPTTYSGAYEVEDLPSARVIKRILYTSEFPDLPKGQIAIFIGSHANWDEESTHSVEQFCEANNAVVFCDHTSGYNGKYRLQFALAASQKMLDLENLRPELLIHVGEVTGDYYGLKMSGNQVWRVSEDGEIRDTFRKLKYIFELPEAYFFEKYSRNNNKIECSYFKKCFDYLNNIRQNFPEIPFSNIWIASQTAHRIPETSTVHFGILNSLRAWNFFDLSNTITSASNVGGFGIDGGLSTFLGASLANPQKLYFCVIGDLAFFYDMNSLGNRHLPSNLRILLVNNGKGVEFKQYGHVASTFGEDADRFISAAGHFGNKSPVLVKHYVEALGFEYLSATNKEEFLNVRDAFVCPEVAERPVLIEVFTDSHEESKALETVMNLNTDATSRGKEKIKGIAKQVLGTRGLNLAKKIIK